MSDIILYSTGCPRCKVLKLKLDKANINYEVVEDIDSIIAAGYKTAPVLKVGDRFYEFGEAVKWIKGDVI